MTACRWRPDPDNPRAANADALIDRAGQVAARVRSAPAEHTILVLGGDCTVGVGTMAGLQHRVERLGVVYVDRHPNLNVPDSTVDGALDWMGVAHMLDIDGPVDGLAAIAGRRPMLSPGQISFLGLGPHTDFAAEVIADRSLPVFDVQRTASDPRGSARAALSPLAACDALAIHFDVDLGDFLDPPLAENTDRGTAPTLASCGEMLGVLSPTLVRVRSPSRSSTLITDHRTERPRNAFSRFSSTPSAPPSKGQNDRRASSRGSAMKKTNDSYCVVFQGDRIDERYYRDKSGWLKVSNRGRVFRMTAEQVLNHVLPALAFGDELGLKVAVQHYERPYWQTIAGEKHDPD